MLHINLNDKLAFCWFIKVHSMICRMNTSIVVDLNLCSDLVDGPNIVYSACILKLMLIFLGGSGRREFTLVQLLFWFSDPLSPDLTCVHRCIFYCFRTCIAYCYNVVSIVHVTYFSKIVPYWTSLIFVLLLSSFISFFFKIIFYVMWCIYLNQFYLTIRIYLKPCHIFSDILIVG